MKHFINFNLQLGIPFASPPLKELRFKKPIEPTPWTEVLDLSSMSTKFCVQEDFFFGQPLAGILQKF